MTQEQLEGNKLIAEFLGFISDKAMVYRVPNLFPDKGYESGYTEFSLNAIGFEKDWNMLIPVVEKIAKIEIKDSPVMYNGEDTFYDSYYPRTFGLISSETKEFMVRINRFGLHYSTSLIEATWLAVVEFLKWYNQNK